MDFKLCAAESNLSQAQALALCSVEHEKPKLHNGLKDCAISDTGCLVMKKYLEQQ